MILPEAQYEEWLDAPAERSRNFLNQYPAERAEPSQNQWVSGALDRNRTCI